MRNNRYTEVRKIDMSNVNVLQTPQYYYLATADWKYIVTEPTEKTDGSSNYTQFIIVSQS